MDLPIELLHVIANFHVNAYRSMLNLPNFARSLTVNNRTDFMINFGYYVIISRYSTKWYLHGKLHRIDGPAVERAGGIKEWWLNGQRHRVDGPAIEFDDGSKDWYLNGKRHRDDGPAAEQSDGTKVWYLFGKRHRVDGPAIEYVNGFKEWWLFGVYQTSQ